jgi:hypothetical protein
MKCMPIVAITRSGLAAAALGLLFIAGSAQVPPSARPDQAAPQKQTDPQQKLDAIVGRMEKAQSDFMEALKAEKDQKARMALYEKRPGLEFLGEFQALGVETKGTEVAAQCWIHAAHIGSDFGKADVVKTAADTLIADHIQSAALDDLPSVVSQATSETEARKYLETLLEKSPRKQVQAGSLFELAQMDLRGEPDKTRQAEAHKRFERLAKDYGDIDAPYGRKYKALAEGFLFECDHLQIGQVAPDFDVTDENGVTFKLSDYRGKVVVLDFWGFW